MRMKKILESNLNSFDGAGSRRMDFALKIVVFLLFVVEVFGRSILHEGAHDNATEYNNTISIAEDGSCGLNGIFYPLNSIFDAPNNPCLVCECNENWTGVISNTSCYNQVCDEIADSSQEGCIPVYDDTKCCVIDFYCRDNLIPDAIAESEAENDNATEETDEVVCPTPICADESCRIEVPPGQWCPTCICEGIKEQNNFEPEYEVSERQPLVGTKNTTEDTEFFLIPVPWSGIDQVESSFEGASNAEGGLERVEVLNPEALEQGNANGIFSEDSSFNLIPGGDSSKRREPRRKRSTNSQIVHHQQQQQQWSVLQEEDQTSASDERERENSEDSGEDYGEMKIFGRQESGNAETANNEITELYEEESVIWDSIVPGCPTPICEHSRCRIGIPPGHKCPTCICNRRSRQP